MPVWQAGHRCRQQLQREPNFSVVTIPTIAPNGQEKDFKKSKWNGAQNCPIGDKQLKITPNYPQSNIFRHEKRTAFDAVELYSKFNSTTHINQGHKIDLLVSHTIALHSMFGAGYRCYSSPQEPGEPGASTKQDSATFVAIVAGFTTWQADAVLLLGVNSIG